MTAREFCYWLQGFFELQEAQGVMPPLTAQQTQTLKNHLAMVFKHEIDPSTGSAQHQQELNSLHRNYFSETGGLGTYC
jgi:hypothetical protein